MDGNALVYCEGAFGTLAGKTAHGLVRFTERYRVLGVIDSTLAGRDAREVLDGVANSVPIFASVPEAIDRLDTVADYLVIGLTPVGGRLGPSHKAAVRQALELSLNVDNGLHELLSADEELAHIARERGVRIRDVRAPRPAEDLHFFTGKIAEVACRRLAVLGTDSAVGKRTTTVLTTKALNEAGVRAAMVGTGQTSWFQGFRHSFCLDALLVDFATGEVEHAVHAAFHDERPQVILIEGQGSLFHPAFAGGLSIVAAGRPHAVILQHAPSRRTCIGFPDYPIVDLDRQIQTLELLAGVPVIAITVNHEGIPPREVPAVLRKLESRHGRPAIDPLREGPGRVVETIRSRFGELDDRGSSG